MISVYCFHREIFAAPVAEFSATPISGFTPLVVQFTDLSEGNISVWAWDIGDGAVSNEQNPSHIYNSEGVFSVTLTVSGTDGSDTITKNSLISTFTANVPTAAFSSTPNAGLVPLVVKFTDFSEPEGEIKSWIWDFGDGGVSTEQNPTHIYRSEGFYSIELIVSNSGGQDVERKNNHINVTGFGTPIAGFSALPTVGKVPLQVQFTDLSEPAGLTTSWFWQFGDGSSSIEKDPLHIYKTGNFFTVKLTVSYEGGANTVTKENLIQGIASPPPEAEFSASPTTGLVELSVDFTDLSEGEIDSRVWNFGDGGISRDENPNHLYRKSGIYTASLTVSNSGGSDNEIKTNFITVISNKPPTAEFQATPTAGFSPLNVQFTDLSEGLVANWLWNFGDGLTSILQNPFHVFRNPGIYTVTLMVSSSDGVGTESKTNLINIQEGAGITSAFGAEPLIGNAPLNVQFIDQSSGNIDSWNWSFGDGGTSAGESNPDHIYLTPGVYAVELTVSGSLGIDTETKVNYITVGNENLPTAAFQAEVSESGFQSTEVQFLDVSSVVPGDSDSSRVNDNKGIGVITKMDDDSDDDDSGDDLPGSIKWHWDFGDGTQSDEQNPLHKYTGTEDKGFDISLLVTDPRGTHLVSKKSLVGVSSIGTGFIKGTVINKETRLPLVGVKTFVKGLDSFQRTKDDGNYFFELMPGSYDLCAEKESFNDLCEDKLEIVSFSSLTRDINMEPVTSSPEPTPDTKKGGKAFTFKCRQSLREGIAGSEKLIMDHGANETCVIKLTQFVPGVTVEVSTLLRKGLRSSIIVEPEKGITNDKGELEVTITALKRGIDWIAWAIPNEKGIFEYSKHAYDTGLAWGMFVEVN